MNGATPYVSVVLTTYNRGDLLHGAVRSVLDQRVAMTPAFELIVVDNNSTDNTRELVRRFADLDERVRYVHEPQQGSSYGRNAGIREACAPVLAFIDDDVRAEPDWLAAILRAFQEHPEADGVGGRVLPIWPADPPAWLTRDHWPPLALVDYGDVPFAIDAEHPMCLVSANLAFRRSVFDVVGPFAPEFQLGTHGILGSVEDQELQLRVLRAGRTIFYDPRIAVRAEIQPNRLQRAYHRRWHTGHGHFYARLRSAHIEATRAGTLFGVPAHLYRQALGDLVSWAGAKAIGESARAFHHEARLRFFHGFFRTRRREFVATSAPGATRGTLATASFSSASKQSGNGTGHSPGTPSIVKLRRAISPLVHTAGTLDARLQRFCWPSSRNVLFDARTAMEYGMMAPVHRRLLADARVRTWLTSSERPDARQIFRDAPREAPVLSPRAAMMKRFDAYVAADLVWATLPRGTRRVQMFHGVAGKFSREYDRPDASMRHWDRLFFINCRRLRNYIASGAIDGSSSAIRLVGMPKSDCLVDGSFTRNGVLEINKIDPARTTVLYAPTWTRFSSLNAMGVQVVAGLINAGYTVLVKLHELSLDPALVNSGGVNWAAQLEPILAKGNGHLIRSADASPWLVAADVLITDHSSIGFEYLLLDRPLIRIVMPELIKRADISQEYVDLIATASTSVNTAGEVIAAVEKAVADPQRLSKERRALAAELFYGPGNATDRATHELYALMELDAPALQPVASVRSAVGTTERVLLP